MSLAKTVIYATTAGLNSSIQILDDSAFNDFCNYVTRQYSAWYKDFRTASDRFHASIDLLAEYLDDELGSKYEEATVGVRGGCRCFSTWEVVSELYSVAYAKATRWL